jgi:hypothetical protein
MTVTTAKLESDGEWQALEAAIAGSNVIPAVQGVLKRARELGAKSVVVEEDYLDRDFSAEFAAFYAGVFRRFPKLCRRFHFFAADVTPILNEQRPQAVLDGLTTLSDNGDYLGYVVAKPVLHAPLGRAVLAEPISPVDAKSDLLVRSTFVAHLLGAALKVTGTPFTQQDRRVGACAQAAIWMAARHFFTKHSGSPWVSTIKITEAASKPTDHMLSRVLPAGSGGLTLEHMVRALREIGREPLLYQGNYDPNTKQVTWPSTMRPAAVIDRYVDSGIPVIVGLLPWETGQSELHAVLAVGHTLRTLETADVLSAEPTRADYVNALLVHDDQRGCYLRLPVTPNDPIGETPYNTSHICYIIVALPGKVFTPAESAEKVSWGILKRYQLEWPTLKQSFQPQIAKSVPAAEEFLARLAANEVVARTYLTYGWRYKQRLIRNSCSEVLKEVVYRQDFSRFVWVTEFGTRNSFNHLDETAVQIFAHSVVDSTSSQFWEGRSIFHAPGFIWRWYHNPDSPFDNYTNSITPIPDETPYGMKIRGTYPI